jgi:hypothetical protein
MCTTPLRRERFKYYQKSDVCSAFVYMEQSINGRNALKEKESFCFHAFIETFKKDEKPKKQIGGQQHG